MNGDARLRADGAGTVVTARVPDIVLAGIGRVSLLVDGLRPLLARGDRALPPRDQGPMRHDKTGIVAPGPARPPVLWRDDALLYAAFESFAHSFWRAQELSLFHLHRHLVTPPLLDFGSGDGSFASALFDRVAFGVDNDRQALEAADERGIYEQLVLAGAARVPLPDEIAGSIMANSVLEHVLDLPLVVTELHRLLKPGSRLLLTVPVAAYERHLIKYFGRRAALRINAEASHRQLLEPEEWRRLLAAHGFTVDMLISYQPPRFTFWYRMFRLLGPRGLAFFWPSLPSHIWRRLRPALVEMVRDSIRGTSSGANIFVVARSR